MNNVVEERFGQYFKPEVRKQGSDLVARGVVALAQSTDSQVGSYIRAGTPAKVTFLADSIESDSFAASCSCPMSTKGRFCKHIWATLLVVEEKHPDFLSSKFNIGSSRTTPIEDGRRTAFKAKQSDYHKQQYQKQKDLKKKDKETKRDQKSQSKKFSQKPAVSYPESVERALEYFATNGFPMDKDLNEENLRAAKRILSRVFHPDKGGTHDETLELNSNFDLLLDYLKS